VARNLVLCFDGTNNQFGPENTSVVRLVQVLDRDQTKQRLYYDPGVGTLPEPNVVTAAEKKVSEWVGLAFGAGLPGKVEAAYSYLMDYYEPDDRVFLFGFSRGAYAARVLAGLLHALGLLPRGGHNLVPYAMRLFKAVRTAGAAGADAGTSSYWRLCDEFRWTFARPAPGGGDQRRFRVHFLGVWDTVSSVGWVWDPATFPFTARNPSVGVVRHAVAVDERRAFFRQNLMQPSEGQDFREVWFPGVHADVGGGYPEQNGGLWRRPFEWIVDEAASAGLLVDPERRERVLSKTKPSPASWNDRMHNSLTPLWWPAEFFPKLRWNPSLAMRLPALGLGRPRYVPPNALLDRTALLRIREAAYAPANLTPEFIAKVRGLANVPDALPYEP